MKKIFVDCDILLDVGLERELFSVRLEVNC